MIRDKPGNDGSQAVVLLIAFPPSPTIYTGGLAQAHTKLHSFHCYPDFAKLRFRHHSLFGFCCGGEST